MYNGNLIKVSNNVNALRTPSVEGVFEELPTVGKSFIIYAEPLHSGSYREVTTSLVVHVKKESNGFRFFTFNSEYLLECLI